MTMERYMMVCGCIGATIVVLILLLALAFGVKEVIGEWNDTDD